VAAVNTSRRILNRKPSVRSSFTTPADSKYGLGVKWRTSLEKLCRYCSKEISLDALASRAAVAESGRQRSLSKLEDMVEVDLSRCCFMPFRSGRKRQLLKKLVHMILEGEVSSASEQNDSEGVDCDGPSSSQNTWRKLASIRILSYKQGLLSLLAPIVEVWFDFSFIVDEKAEGAAEGSPPVEISEDDMTLLRQCSDTFYSLLYCFPSLTRYLCSDGTVDSFQSVFDAALRVLAFWLPNISSCLAWRNFPPALFAVPWATTLMADVLSLADVQYLWSRMFEICEEALAGLQQQENSKEKQGLVFGDQLMAHIIVSSVVQLSPYIDPINNTGIGDNGAVRGTGGCKLLPTQEELLMLFSSTNNDAFHESLFESKKQSQQETLDTDSSGAGSVRNKRMSIGEIARSIGWLLRNTPVAVVIGDSRESSATQRYHAACQQPIWTALGDVPVLSVQEVADVCEREGPTCCPVVIAVNDFDVFQQQLQRTLNADSSADSEQAQKKASKENAHVLVNEMVAALDTALANVSSPPASRPATSLMLLQQLKMAGMVRHFRSLAHDLSGNGDVNRRVTPPLHPPRAPPSLRPFLPQRLGDWRSVIAVGSNSGGSIINGNEDSNAGDNNADTRPDSARSPPISNNNSTKYVITLVPSSSDVNIMSLRDVAAVLATCGFRHVAIVDTL
jgi:hypothetical protein